jgi:DNA polymerase/3'-5' exonuclease PolX
LNAEKVANPGILAWKQKPKADFSWFETKDLVGVSSEEKHDTMDQAFVQVPPINTYIADQLEGMIDLHARDPFRKKAYRTAVANIRSFLRPITSGQMARDSITGVGTSTATAIDQILATGQIAVLAQQPPSEQEKKRMIKLFSKIPQVGIERATAWYNSGYRTYQDLVALYQRGGMTAGQMLGFQHYNDLQQKIPRAEVDAYIALLHQILDPYGVEFEMAGSYRRLKPVSGDIDVVIKSVNKFGQALPMKAIVETLKQAGLIIGSFTPEATAKYMGLARLPPTQTNPNPVVRHFDIRLVDPRNWAYSLLYFTGSGEFNKRMRDVVKSMGYKLSEYGIFLKDTDQSALPELTYLRTEEEIFAFFGFK